MKKMRIMAIALTMVAAFAMTASAADWNFYGSARIATWVDDVDITDKTKKDYTSFSESLQSDARIGANVKVSDELIGRFEYGASEGKANIRQLYGEWNFGFGTLLVGHSNTPMCVGISNQAYGGDTCLTYQGAADASRDAMVRLKFGGFQIAAVAPKTAAPRTATDAEVAGDAEVDFPRIEAKYTAQFAMLTANVAGAYNSFEFTETGETKVHDVDAWVVGADVKANFGPAFVGGSLFLGENAGHIIDISTNGDNVETQQGYAELTGGKLYDNDALGFTIVAGYTLNDMISFEAGYGHIVTEIDKTGAKEDEASNYYAQALITLAPGVVIIPEVGVIDGEDDGVNAQKITYYGAEWKINF